MVSANQVSLRRVRLFIIRSTYRWEKDSIRRGDQRRLHSMNQSLYSSSGTNSKSESVIVQVHLYFAVPTIMVVEVVGC